MNNIISFDTAQEFATFCAAMVREGITFRANVIDGEYTVILTGGY